MNTLITEAGLIKLGFKPDGKQKNGWYYKKQIRYSAGYRDFMVISNKGAGCMIELTSNYGKWFILPLHYKYEHELHLLHLVLTGKTLQS